MLRKSFLSLLFVTGTVFAFSVTDVNPYPENEVTVLPQMASEPHIASELEPQQQSGELLQQAASEPQVESESEWVGEAQKGKDASETIGQMRRMKNPVIQPEQHIKQPSMVQLPEQGENFIPKKLIIMPLPENPTWMKPNGKDGVRILPDKQDVRFYPVKKK